MSAKLTFFNTKEDSTDILGDSGLDNDRERRGVSLCCVEALIGSGDLSSGYSAFAPCSSCCEHSEESAGFREGSYSELPSTSSHPDFVGRMLAPQENVNLDAQAGKEVDPAVVTRDSVELNLRKLPAKDVTGGSRVTLQRMHGRLAHFNSNYIEYMSRHWMPEDVTITNQREFKKGVVRLVELRRRLEIILLARERSHQNRKHRLNMSMLM